MKHIHNFSNPLYTCSCGRKAEEEALGFATHPGIPTSERIWDLRKQLYLMIRKGVHGSDTCVD